MEEVGNVGGVEGRGTSAKSDYTAHTAASCMANDVVSALQVSTIAILSCIPFANPWSQPSKMQIGVIAHHIWGLWHPKGEFESFS